MGQRGQRIASRSPLPHDLTLFVDLQASRPAEAHTALFRGLHAARRPFADHLSLELGESAQHLQHEAAGRRVRIDVLGDALEGSAALLQALDDGEEVLKRSRNTVELVDDQGVAALEIPEEFVEDWSAQRGAGPFFFVNQIDAGFIQSIDLRARFLLLS